jgi:hypothetical protein
MAEVDEKHALARRLLVLGEFIVPKGVFYVRAKALGVSLVAGALALLTGGPVARAAVLMTLPETETINLALPLATDPADFEVVRVTDTTPATVNTNTPQPVSQMLTFNKFDASLGTLTAVTIAFATTYGATATLDVPFNADFGAEPGDPIIFFADATLNHSLAAAGLINTASSLQQFSASCPADPFMGCNNTTPNNGNSFPSPSPGNLTVIGALASFIGSGTYDLTATLTGALAPRISPDNGTDFADNTTFTGSITSANWNGTVSVVYTYNTPEAAVPLPLSLYVVAAGLSGGALWRRYRR